jgi:TPR repeat protein
MHEDGLGVQADVGKAVELCVIAASQGAYLPCVRLARIYATGKAVARSPSTAADWYKRVLAFESEVDDNGEMAEARDFLKLRQGR